MAAPAIVPPEPVVVVVVPEPEPEPPRNEWAEKMAQQALARMANAKSSLLSGSGGGPRGEGGGGRGRGGGGRA